MDLLTSILLALLLLFFSMVAYRMLDDFYGEDKQATAQVNFCEENGLESFGSFDTAACIKIETNTLVEKKPIVWVGEKWVFDKAAD